MQPLSLQDINQKVLSLNSSDKPFSYSADGSTITANWKIADVKWVVILGGGSIDKNYKLVINLDEPSHTYTYVESKSSNQLKFGLQPGGGLSLGVESNSFKGKTIGKSFGAGAGTAVDQNGKSDGNTYKYSFDTKQIKDPLLSLLDQSGWSRKKKGFFSKLFG